MLLGLLTPQAARANAFDHLRTTDDIGLNKIPHMGVSHILVIPSRVKTLTFPKSRHDKMKAFFARAGGPGTFRDYWKTISLGRYDPIPTLVEPVFYGDSCPIPGKTYTHCSVSLDDLAVLGSRGVQAAFEDLLGRVRDEQNVDLSTFDVNSATKGKSDGYFDGIVVDTNLYSGIAFPLAPLSNTVTVGATSKDDSKKLTCGIVALVQPDLHEFGHLFGLIDHYGGPTINGLMADIKSGISAFTRLRLGWGEAQKIDGPQTIELPPVLEGGKVLQIGEAPRYLLVENRNGAKHAGVDSSPKGIYIFSIDEDTLPKGPMGFLDLASAALYLPNKKAPYLNVNLPLKCKLKAPGDPDACAMGPGDARKLVHESGTDSGLVLNVKSISASGSATLTITQGSGNGPGPSESGGCHLGQRGTTPPLALLAALLLGMCLGRSRRRKRR